MPNPLGEALAEELTAHVRDILSSEDIESRCGLTPVVAPTGSGKTTAAVTMFADLLEGGVDGKLVYATANIVDRDAFAAKLEAELERRGSAGRFSIYIAESNLDSITKRAARARDPKNNPLDLPDAALGNDVVRQLASCLGSGLHRYEELKRAGIDRDRAFESLNKEMLDKLSASERDMRKTIRNALRTETTQRNADARRNGDSDCEISVIEYVAGSDKWMWLYDFYPQIGYIESDVVVITHAKLLQPIDTVVNGPVTLADPSCLDDVAVLVIDEGDAFAGTVRQQIIRDACRTSVELFELVGATDMILQEMDPGNQSYLEWAVGKAMLDNLDKQRDKIHEITVEFNLGVKSKYVGLYSSGRDFIFTGGDTYVEGLSGTDDGGWLSVENGDAVNRIKRRSGDEKGEVLAHRVMRCAAVVRGFSRALALAAHKMVERERESRKRGIEALLEDDSDVRVDIERREVDFTDKLKSLVSHLRLPNAEYYVAAAQAERYSIGSTRQKLRGYLGGDDMSFYARGLLLTKLLEDPRHESYTGVDQHAVRLTPEAMLIGAASATLTVAMSATMETQTAANFDMGYMAEALGDLYRALAPERLQRIKRLSDEKNALIAEVVHPQVEVVEAKAEDARIASGDLSGFAICFDNYAKRHADTRSSLFYGSDDKQKRFHATRAARLCCAYRLFRQSMDESGSRSMLCFLGKKIEGVAADDFKRLAAQLERAGCWQTPEPKVLSIDARNWEEMYEGRARGLMERGEAVFILTTYPSAAVAKNMQYTCSETAEGLARIFEDGTGMKDIDCLYFARPSFLLPGGPFDGEDEGYEEWLLTCLYMEAAYYERGEVSAAKYRKRVKQILRGEGWKNGFRSLPSYRAVLARTVSQGAGRVERTGLRCARPLVVLDPDVVEYLDTAAYAGQPTGYIYSAIVEKCRELQNGEGSDVSIEENRAARCNDRAARGIRRLCESGGWTNDKRGVYQRWRGECLRHPTLSDENAREMGALSERWVLMPKPAAVLPYSVEKGAPNQVGAKLGVFGPVQDGPDLIVSEVSCEKSGMSILSKAPFFAGHCRSKGIPMTWEPQGRILPPATFVNFYKGALGEEFVYAFFAEIAEILGKENPLREIEDLDVYEKFDFYAGDGIYIDAKNWRQEEGEGGTERPQVEKALDKLRCVGGKVAVYIQTIDWSVVDEVDPAHRNRIIDRVYDGGLRVVRIPGLISPDGLQIQAASDCLKELIFDE